MEFEFNTAKSEGNKVKHKIDFIEAQKLWDDLNLVEVPVKIVDEERFVVIGKIKEKFWTCVITYREDRIRIISIRRSRKKEVLIYES